MIQHPVRGRQPDKETRFENINQMGSVLQNQRGDSGNHMSGPEENGGDRLPNCNKNSFPEGYVMNCIHEDRPFPWNDVARPVFVNHAPGSMQDCRVFADLTGKMLEKPCCEPNKNQMNTNPP